MNFPSRWINGLIAAVSGVSFALIPVLVFAQDGGSTFDGGGVYEGLDYASGITGLAQGSVRETVLRILYVVLSYLALLAVIMIIAGGIYLVMSFGNEEIKERVKRVVIYTIVGLVIVALARLIVGFVIYVMEQA